MEQKLLMTHNTTGVTSVGKAISTILTTLLSKAVQLQYSACGRKTYGRQEKKSFVDTLTFKCLRGIIIFMEFLNI